jgi:hypothetical protein
MSDPDTALHRLTQAARQAHMPGDLTPFGFATRVLAQVATESVALLWERLGWRSLACATLIVAACLAWDLAAPGPAEDDLLISELSTSLFQP